MRNKYLILMKWLILIIKGSCQIVVPIIILFSDRSTHIYVHLLGARTQSGWAKYHPLINDVQANKLNKSETVQFTLYYFYQINYAHFLYTLLIIKQEERNIFYPLLSSVHNTLKLASFTIEVKTEKTSHDFTKKQLQ